MALTLLLLSAILANVASHAMPPVNNFPIIGVFTQPSTSKEGNCNGNCMYLAASYVKYLESAGARVVPINYSASKAELDTIFNSVNGIFFPGGGSAYPSSAQYIFDKVVAANDAGDYFPLWGTCMGFQWLMIGASNNPNILDPPSGQMDAENYSIPLDFTDAASSSRLFSKADPRITKILGTENVTLNNHHYGIYPEHLASTPSLSSFYKVLSTNKDRAGVPFVSTVEAYNYPIYGSQWHPEKNNYEWNKVNGIPYEAIDHGVDAVLISQYTANFFINEARHNFHKFATSDAEDAALIYNYTPSKTTGSFVQTYFFHF